MKGVDIVWEKVKVPIKIVDRISYDVHARDLSVEVAKAKATGADLLMPITRVSNAIVIIREMVKQNWSPMGINPRGARAHTRRLSPTRSENMVKANVVVPVTIRQRPAHAKLPPNSKRKWMAGST